MADAVWLCVCLTAIDDVGSVDLHSRWRVGRQHSFDENALCGACTIIVENIACDGGWQACATQSVPTLISLSSMAMTPKKTQATTDAFHGAPSQGWSWRRLS